MFGRLLKVGGHQVLPVLASLSGPGTQELSKRRARELADELTRIRRSGELVDLDDEVAALATLARWCARATGDAWMTIAGR